MKVPSSPVLAPVTLLFKKTLALATGLLSVLLITRAGNTVTGHRVDAFQYNIVVNLPVAQTGILQ